MGRRLKIHWTYKDPAFVQYILDSVAEAPEAMYIRLSEEEKKLIEKINECTLEQQLYLLAKLGKRFAIIVMDRKKVADVKSVLELLHLLRQKVIKLVGSALGDWGMFIRADRQVIDTLIRTGLEITPKTMHVLRNHRAIMQNVERVKHINPGTNTEEIVTEVIDRFIVAVHEHHQAYGALDVKRYKVTQAQIPILFYMSLHKRRQVEWEELRLYLPSYSNSFMFQCMSGLKAEGFIDEVGEEKIYTLTAMGVFALQQLRDKITFNT